MPNLMMTGRFLDIEKWGGTEIRHGRQQFFIFVLGWWEANKLIKNIRSIGENNRWNASRPITFRILRTYKKGRIWSGEVCESSIKKIPKLLCIEKKIRIHRPFPYLQNRNPEVEPIVCSSAVKKGSSFES